MSSSICLPLDAPKILLIGKDGQVGFELQRSLSPLGQVVPVGRADCDLADGEALRSLVRREQPRLIVNAAAYTAVDKAEAEPAAAWAINATAPGILGEEGARLGIGVFHYSTDYVFDGRQPRPYKESDIPAPLGAYGRSKLAGEQALAAANPRHLVLRTSWVVGSHGGNFAKTMLRLAGERDRLTVVADQFGAPTSASLLADLTALLAYRYLREGDLAFPWGIYHVAAAGETNWHAYACFVLEAARRAGYPLKAGPDAVQAISSADYPTAAARPSSSRLDTQLFRDTFGLYLPPWQDGVLHILDQLL